MFRFRLPMRMALKRIEKADPAEIDAVISALVEYHERNFPKHELVVMRLSKYDLDKRKKEIERCAELLMKYSPPKDCT